MRKKISNFTFEKFVFFLFLFALALISGSSAEAQTIISDSSNILEIKANSSLTTSTLRFVPSTSVNSFSLQGVGGGSSVSIFDYLSSTSLFKMLNGTLNFNPSNNRIGIGMTDPQQKFSVGSASSDYIQSYGGFIGNPSANIGGTGDAAYFPEGIYSAKMNWLYGGIAMNNGSLSNVGSANFSGNVGIGTTSPSYKLDVAYNGTGVNFNGNYLHNVSAPATGTDAANRFYVDGLVNDIVSAATYWKLDASKTKLYASSTAWNVGIGTTNPGYKLQVDGVLGVKEASGSNATRAIIFADDNGAYYTMDGSSAKPIIFKTWTNGSETMRIDTSGNVGIGTTAPGAFRLYVNGATYTSGNLNVGGDATITGGDVSISNNNGGINFNDASAYWLKTATNWGIYWDTAANQLKFDGAGVTKSFIDLDDGMSYFAGKVGVGVSPTYKLDVAYDALGVNFNGNYLHNVSAPSTTTDAVNKGYLDSALETLSSDLSASTTASNYWAANGANIYNKNTAGNVGIGTSLPSQQLQITKSFELPDTVGATPYGVIYKGGDRFIHNFSYGSNVNGVTPSGRNTFIGEDAGNFTMGSTATTSSQSSYNTGVGHAVLNNNTTGYNNSALGYNALIFNTTGFANSAVGYYSLNANTTGYDNSAIGYYSLFSNTTGSKNSAIGANALDHNTTGSSNSAVGALAFYYHTTGSYNSVVGVGAGRYLANGTSFKYSGDRGLYLGYNSKAGADGATNEIVIGAEAIGGGSNTVTLGNDSITTTRLKGKVGVGVSPAYKLDVAYDGSGVNLTGNTIHNLGAPATGTDAVNRNYVDSVISAQLWAANGNNINNTNLGNVGIGISAPGKKLDVAGAIRTNDQLISTLANGTAPLAVTSATVVTNLNADLLDGQTGSYYDQRVYNSASNYLGGGYNGGGSEKPNWAGFGAGKLKLQMLSGSNVGAPDSWNDVLWISGYTGGDVKGSNALIFSKYNDRIGFVRQDFDSATWGTYREFYHTGNSNLLTVDWKASKVGVGVSPTYKLDVAYDGSGVNLTGNTIHNLGAPTTGTDAVNRNYVDSVIPVIPAQLWAANGNNINNTNLGNVGIGVNTPLAKLQINNEAAFNTLTPGPAAYYGLHFSGQTTADYATGITWSGGTSGTQAGIYVQGSGSYGSRMYFATTNSYATGAQNRMIINEGGNVGIGTTAPGAFRLYVNGATYTSGNLNVGGDATITGGDVTINNNNGGINFNDASAYWLKTATNYGIYWDTTDNQFKFNGAGVTKASIDLDDGMSYFAGKVGVGVSPAYKLDVAYDGSGVNLTGNIIHNLGAPATGTDAVNRNYVDSNFAPIGGGASLWATSSAGIYNVGLGKVGIGTTGPSTALQVAGTVTATQFNGSGAGLTGTAASLTAGAVSGLTLNSSAAPIVPDNVTQNQIGYNTGFGLFGASDGGLYSSAYSSAWIHQIYGDFRTGRVAVRGKNSGTWQPWRTVLDSLSDVASDGALIIKNFSGANNSIQKGNVAIGNITPAYKLDVVGDGNFNSNYIHGVRTPVLSADAVNRSYVDDNFSPLASQAWKLSGSNVYTSSTAWNVGIGTTNPLTRLYVFGSARDPFVSGTDPRSIASFVGDTKDGLYIGAFADPLKGLWLQASDSNDLSVKYPLTLNPNGGNVGIGTSAPASALHVQGASYLNGQIKTSLTGTGSRCLHVDSNGVIGTMAGDCGTSTGGDNLGNGIASTNIALGNYWLSGDGGNEGVFVKADGKVGIGDSAPGNKLTISGDVGINGSSNSILFNLHTISASGRSYLNFQSDEAYGAHTYSIDSLYAVTSNPTLSGAMLSLNPSGGGVSFGGSIVVPNAVYNADSSRWLSFGPSGDSLKVAGNLNTTAGALNVSGTGNSWIMGKLGVGTTNPNSTAGMTIDTAATAPSILFRNAGSDKALISFRNGINFTMNSSMGAPVVPGNTGSSNIGIGSYTFYTGTGSSNIGIGVGAARSSSGNGNIAIGISAMDSTGAGSSNIAIGNSALYQGTSGAYNIAIGVNALNGSGIGGGNIAIGNRGQWTNSSNKLYIGDLNPGLTDLPLIYGDMTSTTTGAVGIKTTNLQSGMAMTVAGKIYADDFIYSSSDARLKHDIKNLSEIDYQKILKLRPVSFTYNKNNSKGFGFIAQELEKLYPEMVETNESDGMKSVTYDNLISPTIMAIQEQQKKIEEQETLIQILLDRVNKLENSTK